ncbi:hypothetical protein PFLUV_G00175520 [Perca fluviatilis]|uniref:Uncharacterized protein n=1 Tax=Perca fluviatilis TaxID=8168 RepID=A0A6A5EKE0_PERFL|nr:hypothetical protein PFLUV_G00175520 [Perca fluviatilis]
MSPPGLQRCAHRKEDNKAVRRLHNSETNCSRRYEPEQGLTSTHNEAVTYICSELSASPDLHDADNDAIVYTLRDSTQELQLETTRCGIAGRSCEKFSLESVEKKRCCWMRDSAGCG